MSLLAVYREPFGLMPQVHHLPEGETLAQMAARVRGLPADFERRGIICINGQPVYRQHWGRIRPKPVANGVTVEITFHAPPMGGGDDGGKSVLALVASIALTLATGFIAGGGLATKFGLSAKLFGAGTFGATALAAGVSLAGSLLLAALVPPPTTERQSRIRNPGTASAEGNVLEPNTTIPRVVGSRKVFPPLLAEPLTYFEGPDEIVEAVYGLSGPHALSDIRIGAAPIESMRDVEFEIREGWPGDLRLSLVERQSRTEALQAELRGHTVSDDDGRTLESTSGDTASALPQPQIVGTRDDADECQLHLIFGGGLHKSGSETVLVRVPVRVRIREAGTETWTNLPELHFQAANLRQLRASIRLIWTDDATTSPGAGSREGWVEGRVHAPGQTAAPAQPDWDADAYFYTGSGDQYMTSGNLGATGVDHLILDQFTAAVYLDTASFPKGRYEIEVVRGAAFLQSAWSASAYTISGDVWDLFGYQGVPGQVPISRDGIADTLHLLRAVSIWNEHPVPTDDMALIAVKARNRQLDAVSVVAGGYVPDWNGSAWATWAVTDNPAPHYRDILTGHENADPVPVELIDDAGLVAWRTACASAGHTCNALLEGQTVGEAARIVAACGYAKPYMSEIWGVTRDYDRSAEAPVQVFTPRNSSGFGYRKAFPRVPDGFRVTFRDATRDYEARQITVFRPGASDDSGLVEQVNYEGLVIEADAVARATYDQAQPASRGTFYSLDAPAEALVCRRGDLVGVQHDMLSAHAGSARVLDFALDGSGAVTEIVLDAALPVSNEPYMDAVANLAAVADLSMLGRKTGVALRRQGGSVTVHLPSNATGETDTLTFSPAIDATGLAEDALVTVGPAAREYLRLIVFAVEPRPNYEASLTLVDEAPELWA